MKMQTVQFVYEDADFGTLPLNFQQVIPLHCLFPGKLSRGNNDIGYKVWSDDVPAMTREAKLRGYSLQVL